MATDQRAPRPATLGSAFAIAWPASLAAIVSPLLGLIDVAVLARASGTDTLAGASLAGAVFSLLYWTFGFIRMSMSGLAAQAYGASNVSRLKAHLIQGVAFGITAGALLVITSPGIERLALWAMVDTTEASQGAGDAMVAYFRVRILAAPAVLTMIAILGWLSGQGKTGLLMVITLSVALVNAGLSILFVLNLGWGITGLAAATVVAELTGLLLALVAVWIALKPYGPVLQRWRLVDATRDLAAVLSFNRDIFIRTAILTFVLSSFARIGAGFGDLTVAANQALFYLVLTATLLLDGTAIAAESLVGQALGANHDKRTLFTAAWRRTAELAAMIAAGLCLALIVFGGPVTALIIGQGPENAALLAEAQRYRWWVAAAPLAVAVTFHLDGVYIGATRGAAMRNVMALSALIYFASAFALMPILGNHGLWSAFTLFMLARGIGLIAGWSRFEPLLAAESRA